MKKLLLSFTFFTFISSMEGALSPFYQSVQEIKCILDNQYLAIHFPQGEPISEIHIHEEGEGFRIYRLASQDHYIFAKLNYLEAKKLGPRQYEISWSYFTK